MSAISLTIKSNLNLKKNISIKSKRLDKNHLELGIAPLNEIIKYDGPNTFRNLKF